MDFAGEVRELIKDEKFEEALELGKDLLADPTSYTTVTGALKELTAELRHACMLMAVKKMDVGREYFSKEELLKKACKLVGEDMAIVCCSNPASCTSRPEVASHCWQGAWLRQD